MITERKDIADKVLSRKLVRDIPGTTEYFIAGDDDKVIHYGEVDDKHQMETGQPHVRVFKDEQEWVDALLANGVDPDAEDILLVDKLPKN